MSPSPGFFHVVSSAEFMGMLSAYPPLGAERVSFDACDGRVVAQEIMAPEDLPPAGRSSMDGYAVRAADVFGASESNPAYLALIGSVPVHEQPTFSLQPGQCAGVVTGSALPEGADAVIMVEYTDELGHGEQKEIEIRTSAAPGDHVMLRAEDAAAGTPVLAAGHVLRPQEIGLLAGLGITQVPVHALPRVGIISTGDELVEPGEAVCIGQMRDVNTSVLAAMVRRTGAAATTYGIVTDSLEPLKASVDRALAENDVVLISGGSSVGVRDLTIHVLEAIEGAEIQAHGVAVSPGKPMILARVPAGDGVKAVLGLPGQVTSAAVTTFVFVLPFLRRLAGDNKAFDQRLRPSKQAVLSRNIGSKQGREDYIRVRLEQAEPDAPDAPLRAVPLPGKSGLLSSMVKADGLVRIPAGEEGFLAGRVVEVLLFTT